MLLRVWRFITLLFTALALTMTSARLLELPQKMTYDASLYTVVNTTMYRYFAIVGGIYTVGSIVTAIVLAILVRRRRATRRWTLAGAVALVLGFVTWLMLVEPVNTQIAAAQQTSPTTVPALWMGFRDRWEYGHATGFVFQLLGFSALIVSVLVEIPRGYHRKVSY
jgi:thiamine transporter ThiT